MQRPTLQKLFVSVNQIKSVHRKDILIELSERTSEIVNSKRPELIRKKVRELKYDLVNEYCEGVMLAMYQYSVRYQIAGVVQVLRALSFRHPPQSAASRHSVSG